MTNKTSGDKINLFTATSIVVANMVGTGVFTSLGFQAAGLHQGYTIMVLWVAGAIVALTGALCYGELGSMFPQSGGEYNYLSKIYHPALGFAAGWVSITVGFAAPVAAAAMALGVYFQSVFAWANATALAALVVVVISIIQSFSLKTGGRFQNYTTSIKILAIVFIIVFGINSEPSGGMPMHYSSSVWPEIFSPAFASSFFFVSLAYSGWNAAGYIASEIKNPQVNLPRSLFLGTALVAFLYVILNYIFLYVTPVSVLQNENGPVVDIAGVAAHYIFGEKGGKIMSLIISFLLISTISAMIMAGPRVSQSMGNDHKIFRFFSYANSKGIPLIAIGVQCLISLFFIFTATFSQVVIYIAFTLNLFTFLSVLGIFIMRIKSPEHPRHYKTWAYPFVPIVFLAITAWLIYFGFQSNPIESLYGLLTAFSGIPLWLLGRKKGTD